MMFMVGQHTDLVEENIFVCIVLTGVKRDLTVKFVRNFRRNSKIN